MKQVNGAQPSAMRPYPEPGMGNALIGAEEEALVLDVLRRKTLFRYQGAREEQGLMANRFEGEIRRIMGVGYALGVTSGSAALEVALAALGVGPGDEVIIPAWSWVSCFTSVVRLGALPVLAEIDESLSLAQGEITRLRTSRTKVVMILHYQGVAADLGPLIAEARRWGIKVLEDCAQSIGASYHGKRVGSMGDAGIYSFNYSKTISTGEGGMVVTQDRQVYERAVRFHDLGFVRPSHTLQIEPEMEPFCGAQYRMTELVAAVGIAQLGRLDTMREHCRALRGRLFGQIGGLSGVGFRHIPDPSGDSAFESYLLLPDAETARAFTERLESRRVYCSKGTGTYAQYKRPYCLSRSCHVAYASPFQRFVEWPALGYRTEDFPRTEAMNDRLLALPIGALYTRDDVDHMAAMIREVHGELI